MSIIKKYLHKILLNSQISFPETNNLVGKVILVTGAGKGIGLATADMLHQNGATVIGVSRDIALLKSRISKANNNHSIALSVDITSESAIKNLIKKVVEQHGKIDVLINNAGLNIEKPLELTTKKEFESIFDTNVKAAYLLCREVIPFMKKAKAGTIINIGSKISHNTNVGANKVLYTTTKYALEGFSFALNRELKKSGVRVSCLMPGTVNTFVSRKGSQFMSPYQVAGMIDFIIKHDDIDFESILIKSKSQNI